MKKIAALITLILVAIWFAWARLVRDLQRLAAVSRRAHPVRALIAPGAGPPLGDGRAENLPRAERSDRPRVPALT